MASQPILIILILIVGGTLAYEQLIQANDASAYQDPFKRQNIQTRFQKGSGFRTSRGVQPQPAGRIKKRGEDIGTRTTFQNPNTQYISNRFFTGPGNTDAFLNPEITSYIVPTYGNSAIDTSITGIGSTLPYYPINTGIGSDHQIFYYPSGIGEDIAVAGGLGPGIDFGIGDGFGQTYYYPGQSIDSGNTYPNPAITASSNSPGMYHVLPLDYGTTSSPCITPSCVFSCPPHCICSYGRRICSYMQGDYSYRSSLKRRLLDINLAETMQNPSSTYFNTGPVQRSLLNESPTGRRQAQSKAKPVVRSFDVTPVQRHQFELNVTNLMQNPQTKYYNTRLAPLRRHSFEINFANTMQNPHVKYFNKYLAPWQGNSVLNPQAYYVNNLSSQTRLATGQIPDEANLQ